MMTLNTWAKPGLSEEQFHVLIENTHWATQQIPFPFFIKLDPVLRLSDLELFMACWAETKGKTLSYNPNTMIFKEIEQLGL